MCLVKEHLDWPSVNRVPNLLRYFMFYIFFTCMGLWLLACWDCGFISHRGHLCLSVVRVVCCQVEVSAMGWSLVHSCPTECVVSECDCEATIMRRPWPTGDSCAIGGGDMLYLLRHFCATSGHTRVAQKVMPHIFFSHSTIEIAMWKLRGSKTHVYCAHVCKYEGGP